MKPSKLFDLSGNVAIVTGGARGLGKIIALALSDAGADVVIADVLTSLADDAVKEIEKNGNRALGIKLDVTSEKDVKEMVSKVTDHFGKIDILINNAGIQCISPAEDFALEDWNRVLNINLTGLFLCSQAVGKMMISRKKGKIINISSLFGTIGSPHGAAAYNSSKAGVINLTRSLAVEWGKHNINVNAIAPGIIETDLTRKRLENKEYFDLWIDRTPLERIGKPDDLSGAVIYLSSKASDFVTGHTIMIDGGYSVQ
jgi:NAD(P)-dependent dehydrogenase (short-subunit alcohol dehydrogenase family)